MQMDSAVDAQTKNSILYTDLCGSIKLQCSYLINLV